MTWHSQWRFSFITPWLTTGTRTSKRISIWRRKRDPDQDRKLKVTDCTQFIDIHTTRKSVHNTQECRPATGKLNYSRYALEQRNTVCGGGPTTMSTSWRNAAAIVTLNTLNKRVLWQQMLSQLIVNVVVRLYKDMTSIYVDKNWIVITKLWLARKNVRLKHDVTVYENMTSRHVTYVIIYVARSKLENQPCVERHNRAIYSGTTFSSRYHSNQEPHSTNVLTSIT